MKVIQIVFIAGLIGLSLSVSASQVVKCAKEQLNKPFKTNANGPDSFDSSGLAYYCHGSSIPRTAAAQASGGSAGDGSAGDLVFFDTNGNGGVSFTGICVGGGKMIYAPKPGDVVKYATYAGNSYWSPKLKGYKRYWS